MVLCFPVMLRGRCMRELSAISYQRPGSKKEANPSPALRPLATSHPPLATALVTPIIPVHPGNSPVSPIIPVHTQKQGVGGAFLNFQLGIRPRMPILREPAAAGEPKDLPLLSPLTPLFSPAVNTIYLTLCIVILSARRHFAYGLQLAQSPSRAARLRRTAPT